MNSRTATQWLIVLLAIVGLALIAPAVSAHETAPPGDDITVSDRSAWMESHMTQHVGPDGFVWMEAQMDYTVDEMARFMSNGHSGPHAQGC